MSGLAHLYSVSEKIYIAGPMRNIPNFNFPAFHRAAVRLRALGHEVFNPAERDEAVYGPGIGKSTTGYIQDAAQKGFSLREALEGDTRWICRSATAIALLPGWIGSRGARAERALGLALGLPIYYLDADGSITEQE